MLHINSIGDCLIDSDTEEYRTILKESGIYRQYDYMVTMKFDKPHCIENMKAWCTKPEPCSNIDLEKLKSTKIPDRWQGPPRRSMNEEGVDYCNTYLDMQNRRQILF